MTKDSTTYRSDVQGVRALAVSIVVIYHVDPRALPGGYVGVDVFFVISGFLITGLLARGFARTGRVRLLEFYGRRARRLMPAAALVLAVTWVASRVLLPVSQLPAAAEQIRASALYFQNVALADDAVDYLKANQAASPVQHFWSLSVEEQFYLVWPLLFVLAAAATWVAGRWGRPAAHRIVDGASPAWPVPVFLLGTAVVAGSFWYSLHLTASNPASAYYVTPARIWELGAGGLLALLPVRISRQLGRFGALAWLGIAAIAVSAVTYSAATAFPGEAALLPVLGTVLLLACGSTQARFGPAVLTTTRPLIFLGGISYSLYLWHWPVVVLYQAYRGHGIGLGGAVGVLVLSVALAWLTKRFVEDPVREARVVTRSSLRSLATVGLAVVPVLLASIWLADQPGPGKLDSQHPGAPTLATGSSAPASPSTSPSSSASLVPALAEAAKDLPAGITPACETSRVRSTLTSCVLGDTKDPTKTVALVGDSHAGQWSDALDQLAKQQHWKLYVAIKGECPMTAVLTTRLGQSAPNSSCLTWGKTVMSALLTTVKPDVVITSDRPYLPVAPSKAADATSLTKVGEGMAKDWENLQDHGIDVVGIDETPEAKGNVPDCLSSKGGTVASCSQAASSALTHTSPIQVAAAEAENISSIVDLTDLLCSKSTCPVVIGNVIVYSDAHHLTRTYTMSLEPYLAKRLLATPAFGSHTP